MKRDAASVMPVGIRNANLIKDVPPARFAWQSELLAEQVSAKTKTKTPARIIKRTSAKRLVRLSFAFKSDHK
jgi:hypothetical protein